MQYYVSANGLLVPRRAGGCALNIMTANLYFGRKKNFRAFKDQLGAQQPDVLLVQECRQWFQWDQYTQLIVTADGVGVYVRNDSQWVCRAPARKCCFKKERFTTRVATAHTFVAKGGGPCVTIANVHLSGGRDDEQSNCNGIGDNELIEVKQELIQRLLELQAPPDIVVGDFNSDMGYYTTNQDNLEQLQFLTDECRWTSDKRIRIWNSAPFCLLESNGYKSQYNGVRTSRFGNTPDAVWYTGNLICEKQDVVGLIGADISDHDALMARFTVQGGGRGGVQQVQDFTRYLLALRGIELTGHSPPWPFETALAEIKAGHKVECWSWYFLPCGYRLVLPNGKLCSYQSQYYSVNPGGRADEKEAATAYLRVDRLRNTYSELMFAILDQLNNEVDKKSLLGVDVPKAHASATLFASVSAQYPELQRALWDVAHRLQKPTT
jgi:endonuclease/exonuclease/phosphatase family metal-dependent hydrolase/uncharacterized protein (DUF1810 family)